MGTSVGPNGNVTLTGTVYALNADTGAKVWSYSSPLSEDSATNFSGINVVDGVVYVGAITGSPRSEDVPLEVVYAFSLGADLLLRAQPSTMTVHQGDLLTFTFPVWNLGNDNAVHEVLNTRLSASISVSM